LLILPGFRGSTTGRTLILDAAVRQVFDTLVLDGVPTRRLDEIADITSGGTPHRGTSEFYGGSIPWAKIGDVTAAGKWISETQETITESGLDASSARLFPEGTVLFSMYGSIGKTSITRRSIATNQAILGLIPGSGVNAEFIYYALIYARASLFSGAKGTSQANINGAMVKSFRVPLPDPEFVSALVRYLDAVEQGNDLLALGNLPPLLEKQRRVVRRIEQLAAQADQAHLARLSRDREVAALCTVALGGFFASRPGWQEVRLSDICKRPQYGFTASASVEPVGPRMLRITDIQDGRVKWRDVPYCDCAEADAYLLAPGDILFARTGATTGKSYLVGECPRAVFASYLIRLRVRESVTPEYLYQFFQSPQYWVQVMDRTRGTGQPNCSASTLSAIRVPLPPRAQQLEVAARAELVQRRIMRVESIGEAVEKSSELVMPATLRMFFPCGSNRTECDTHDD
jgi:type I restriction enzyme S subunit